MLPCGCETHTDELFHGTLFPECIKAQAEFERKSAVYDTLAAKLRSREIDLIKFLHDASPSIDKEQKHLDKGTTERAYWHYGYLVALRDALELFAAAEPAKER